MNTQPITPASLAASVIAVPPLARNADLSFQPDENRRLVEYLEAGGIRTLLYGGNAVLYHVAMSEYAELLALLSDIASDETTVIPSAGPTYGTMMDHAAILRDFDFPTVMILPQKEVSTSAGIAKAVRQFVESAERQAVLYIKHDGYMDLDDVQKLIEDDLISWVKYAIVRTNTADDDYLRALVDRVGGDRVVSGIGEQPAIIHLRDFNLGSFTSGCVCAAPRLSMTMLRAIQDGHFEQAEAIRATFRPLEDLRNEINPIRVLHAAVSLAGLGEMGPLVPLLSPVSDDEATAIEVAAKQLVSAEQTAS